MRRERLDAGSGFHRVGSGRGALEKAGGPVGGVALGGGDVHRLRRAAGQFADQIPKKTNCRGSDGAFGSASDRRGRLTFARPL